MLDPGLYIAFVSSGITEDIDSGTGLSSLKEGRNAEENFLDCINFALEAAVGYFETKASTSIPNTDRKFSVYPLEEWESLNDGHRRSMGDMFFADAIPRIAKGWRTSG